MNRPIKFRAWAEKEKIWLSSTIVNIELDGTLIVNDYSSEKVLRQIRKDIILQQFTGLLDKNGKEIYEGDVVSVQSDIGFGEIELNTPRKAIIEYATPARDRYGFVMEYENGGFDELRAANNVIEVIGNIHENPDLIK